MLCPSAASRSRTLSPIIPSVSVSVAVRWSMSTSRTSATCCGAAASIRSLPPGDSDDRPALVGVAPADAVDTFLRRDLDAQTIDDTLITKSNTRSDSHGSSNMDSKDMTPPDGDPCHAIRLAAGEDVPFLRSMLVEAANWSPNKPRRSAEETLSDPQVAHYLDGWPRAGDFGFVALDRLETRIGACWVRYMPIQVTRRGPCHPDLILHRSACVGLPAVGQHEPGRLPSHPISLLGQT
jgi:hypothetical protein